MGYSYGMNPATGRYTMLVCDSCGKTKADGVGVVRKRTCPFRVSYPNNTSLPYCYPAALCSGCYAKNKSTLHATCKDSAERETARHAAVHAKLVAGDMVVKSAFGDWHPSVPKGMTGVMFRGPEDLPVMNASTKNAFRLVPAGSYDPGAKQFLSDYPDAVDWTGPEAR